MMDFLTILEKFSNEIQTNTQYTRHRTTQYTTHRTEHCTIHFTAHRAADYLNPAGP